MRAPEFWNRTDLQARTASALLAPLGWLYGASVAWKRDHAKSSRCRASIVCVGNLTAGGSGKTPVALAIAELLKDKGVRVTFLSRGYGGRLAGPLLVDATRHGAAEVGDEPLLLANMAPTIIARDRRAGAVLAESTGADVIVMDDGHQNFSLAKDLSLVVVDGKHGFGNGRVLPAGPLREPVMQGLRRADAVIVMGDGWTAPAQYPGPVLRAQLVAAGESLARGPRVIAFAGIGRPAKFFATLKALGAETVATRSFADHHSYTDEEVSELKNAAAAAGAVLMTTEKDFVRLNATQKADILRLPVRAVFEDLPALERLLDPLMKRPPAAAQGKIFAET